PASARRRRAEGMDAYVERTVQLRDPARARTERRRTYSFEIAAVLCVALIAATAWAVLAAGWVNGGGGAVVVGVAAVIEAALLARVRARRIAVVIAAPVLGLAAIVPTTLAALPAIPHQTAGRSVSHYISAPASGLSL